MFICIYSMFFCILNTNKKFKFLFKLNRYESKMLNFLSPVLDLIKKKEKQNNIEAI